MTPAVAGSTSGRQRSKLEALVCIAVICGLLTLGLWPFHAPLNHVTWLSDRNGIEVVKYGTIWSASRFESRGDGPCSLEIWFQPAPVSTSGTLLAFSAPREPFGFRIGQYQSDAIFETPSARFELADIFREGRPTFLTFTAEGNDTVTYVDGVLRGKTPQFWHFHLSSADLRGIMVIGSSPRQQDSWRGRIYGLAFYNARLDPAQVVRNYGDWRTGSLPRTGPAPFTLYPFNEHNGSIVHSTVQPGIDLVIPKRFAIVDQYHMEPFWKEFRPTLGYVQDTLTNIVGFIPAGFVFYSFFSIRTQRRAAFAATILGTCVSLAIEVTQGWLPTRSSGTTDLFTNTLGTYLGVLLYGWRFARNAYDRVLGSVEGWENF